MSLFIDDSYDGRGVSATTNRNRLWCRKDLGSSIKFQLHVGFEACYGPAYSSLRSAFHEIGKRKYVSLRYGIKQVLPMCMDIPIVITLQVLQPL